MKSLDVKSYLITVVLILMGYVKFSEAMESIYNLQRHSTQDSQYLSDCHYCKKGVSHHHGSIHFDVSDNAQRQNTFLHDYSDSNVPPLFDNRQPTSGGLSPSRLLQLREKNRKLLEKHYREQNTVYGIPVSRDSDLTKKLKVILEKNIGSIKIGSELCALIERSEAVAFAKKEFYAIDKKGRNVYVKSVNDTYVVDYLNPLTDHFYQRKHLSSKDINDTLKEVKNKKNLVYNSAVQEKILSELDIINNPLSGQEIEILKKLISETSANLLADLIRSNHIHDTIFHFPTFKEKCIDTDNKLLSKLFIKKLNDTDFEQVLTYNDKPIKFQHTQKRILNTTLNQKLIDSVSKTVNPKILNKTVTQRPELLENPTIFARFLKTETLNAAFHKLATSKAVFSMLEKYPEFGFSPVIQDYIKEFLEEGVDKLNKKDLSFYTNAEQVFSNYKTILQELSITPLDLCKRFPDQIQQNIWEQQQDLIRQTARCSHQICTEHNELIIDALKLSLEASSKKENVLAAKMNMLTEALLEYANYFVNKAGEFYSGFSSKVVENVHIIGSSLKNEYLKFAEDSASYTWNLTKTAGKALTKIAYIIGQDAYKIAEMSYIRNFHCKEDYKKALENFSENPITPIKEINYGVAEICKFISSLSTKAWYEIAAKELGESCGEAFSYIAVNMAANKALNITIATGLKPILQDIRIMALASRVNDWGKIKGLEDFLQKLEYLNKGDLESFYKHVPKGQVLEMGAINDRSGKTFYKLLDKLPKACLPLSSTNIKQIPINTSLQKFWNNEVDIFCRNCKNVINGLRDPLLPNQEYLNRIKNVSLLFRDNETRLRFLGGLKKSTKMYKDANIVLLSLEIDGVITKPLKLTWDPDHYYVPKVKINKSTGKPCKIVGGHTNLFGKLDENNNPYSLKYKILEEVNGFKSVSYTLDGLEFTNPKSIFPEDWDLVKCTNKILQGIQNISKATIKDGFIEVTGKTSEGYLIKYIIDSNNGHVKSVYADIQEMVLKVKS